MSESVKHGFVHRVDAWEKWVSFAMIYTWKAKYESRTAIVVFKNQDRGLER